MNSSNTKYLFRYLARLLFFKYSLKYWKYDSVAQLAEHETFNFGVLGSSPSGVTKGDTQQ